MIYLQLFREPDSMNKVDAILKDYAVHCNPTKDAALGNGAMLLSVVGKIHHQLLINHNIKYYLSCRHESQFYFDLGGRLSEGINFSNELCRCVAVVGLPYPNIKSPELRAKMEYQKSKFKSVWWKIYLYFHFNFGLFKVSEGKDPASEYYNNLCMKAVNQCIGRAIRHQNDYAAMLLLDQRYQAQHVRSALPSWIERNLTICKDFNVGRSSLLKVRKLNNNGGCAS
jgi:Helicase C-terminal domain